MNREQSQQNIIQMIDKSLLVGVLLFFSICFVSITAYAGSIVTRCGGSGCGFCPNGANHCDRPSGYGGIYFSCNLSQMQIENGYWKCESNPVFLGTGGGSDSINTGQTCGGQQIDVCEGAGSGCTGGPGGRLRDFIVYRDDFCVTASPTPTPPPPPPQAVAFSGVLYCGDAPVVPMYGGYTVDLVGDGQAPITVPNNQAHFLTNVLTSSNISAIRIVSEPPGSGEYNGPYCRAGSNPTNCTCNPGSAEWTNCGNPTMHNLDVGFQYYSCTPQPARSCNVETFTGNCVASGTNSLHRVSWRTFFTGFNNFRAIGRYDAPPYNNFPGPEDIVHEYTNFVISGTGGGYYATLNAAATGATIPVQTGVQYNYTLAIQNGTSAPDCTTTQTFTCSAAPQPGSMVVNIRDTNGNPVNAERICYGGTHPNYAWSTSLGTCQDNVSSFTMNPINASCGAGCITTWHFGAQTIDLPDGYSIVSTTPNYQALISSAPVNPPYPGTALVNRDLVFPEAGRTNVWSYFWDSFWYDQQRVVTIVVENNNPPVANTNITSNVATCGVGQITGRYPTAGDPGGINNPLTLTTTFSDPDGVNDLRYFAIWVTNDENGTPDYPADVSKSAFINIRRNSSTNYQKFHYGPSGGYIQLSDPRIVATVNQPLNTQALFPDLNTVLNPASNAIAYVIPSAPIENAAAGTITFNWQIGLLNSAAFDDSIKIYTFVLDSSGTGGWTLATQAPANNWYADLINPSSGIAYQFSGTNNLNVTYNSADNRGLAASNYFTKLCRANNLMGSETINLSRPGGSFVFSVANAISSPCLGERNLGTINYTYTNNSTNGQLSFEFRTRDQACNQSPLATATAVPPATWMMTSGGDIYASNFTFSIPGGVTIANTGPEITEAGQTPFAARYTFSSGAAAIANASLRGYVKSNYTDANVVPRDVGAANWFSLIRGQVRAKADVVITQASQNYTVPASATTTSAILTLLNGNVPVDPNAISVVELNSITFNNQVTCNTRTIFIINTTATIYPNFTTPGNTNGCIFLSQGNTTISAGSAKGSTGTQVNYDIVDAFIITDTIITSNDSSGDGLLIRGGVVSHAFSGNNTSITNIFGRTINLTLAQRAPAELIRYDARYNFIFEDLFNYELDYIIREKPFVDSLSH